MPSPGDELSSIDFESLIGGPLTAVVNAQAQAAITTVNFIKSVGFKKPQNDEFNPGEDSDTADPIYVSFKYPKEVSPYIPAVPANPGDANANPPIPATAAQPAVNATYETYELRVPILTILPIPYLRIEETTIDFNAKINSVEFSKTDTSVKLDTSTSGSTGWGLSFYGSAKVKASFSFQMNTTSGSRVERTYSMAVHVRAVQDEMPGGMERILGILEDAIVSVPSGTVGAHPAE